MVRENQPQASILFSRNWVSSVYDITALENQRMYRSLIVRSDAWMRLVDRVFTPSVCVLNTELVVEEGGRAFVPAIAVETLVVVSHCPVRRLVFDKVAALQSGQCRTDCAFLEADSGSDLTSFERLVGMCDEKAQHLVG